MKFLLLAACAWLTTPFPADGLRRERLPADVDFVVHFDLEGFKATQLWRQVSESPEAAEMRAGIEDLEEIKSRFGIDPLTDVRALTLFKTKAEEDPTVVLFSTTAAIDEALRRFQGEPGYARVLDSGIELHTWQEGDDDSVFAYLHLGPGAERVVVLASNRLSAVRAARVLRGEEANHASGGFLLQVAPAPGSFLYLAAAEIPHLDEFTPASRVFGSAQGIQVDLGEAGGFLRGHLGVITTSAQDAFDVSSMLNGLIALARLAGHEAGEALELLTGLRVNTRGSEVTVDFEYGVERLLEILATLAGEHDEDGDDQQTLRSEIKIQHEIK